MREARKSALLSTGTLTLLLMLLHTFSWGQVFNAAVTPEIMYPPIPPLVPSNPVTSTSHSSCYSFDRPTGFGPAQLLVHGWDDGVVGLPGIAWRALDPMNIPYNEGYINYPNGVRDLEVAMYHDPAATNGWYVIAAYYNTNPNMGVTGQGVAGAPLNPGHFYDLWDWTPGGLNYISTTQLSTQPSYTRISIDAHLGYAIVIAWEEPGGIMFTAAEASLGFGPIISLTGTAGEQLPDVAFSHTGTTGAPGIHFVYNRCIKRINPKGGITLNGRITESIIPWNAVIPPSVLTTIAPTIEDINILPNQCGDFRTHLDCPDHSGPDDWAYSYVDLARNRVFARIMDQGISPTAITHCLNDGSLIGLSAGIDLQAGAQVTNDWPVLSYQMNNPDLYVGWHTQYDNWIGFPAFGPANGMYVGFSMNTAGNITSTPDYNLIPTNLGLVPSFTPAITFSKNNEHPYMFGIYAMYDGADNMFYNKYQPWFMGTYKPTAIPEEVMAARVKDITVYPSPFRDKLNINIPAELNEKQMTIGILNMMGTLVSQFNGKGADAQAFLAQASSKLANNIYVVNIEVPEGNFRSSVKVQKVE